MGFALREQLGWCFRGVFNIFIGDGPFVSPSWCRGDAQVSHRNALKMTKPAILNVSWSAPGFKSQVYVPYPWQEKGTFNTRL